MTPAKILIKPILDGIRGQCKSATKTTKKP